MAKEMNKYMNETCIFNCMNHIINAELGLQEESMDRAVKTDHHDLKSSTECTSLPCIVHVIILFIQEDEQTLLEEAKISTGIVADELMRTSGCL